MSGARLPIPRVVRSKGYRSQAPALNETKQVSSHTFSSSDLRGAVSDGQLELRGNTSTGAQEPIGLLALGLARGAEVHRRR